MEKTINRNLGDEDVVMSFNYYNGHENYTYKVSGGELDYVPNMIEHFVQFIVMLGFPENIVHKFMRLYLDENEE